MEATQTSMCDVEPNELARGVGEALGRIPHLPFGAIDWELEQSTLVLRGRVGTFHVKQLVQSAMLRLPGIQRVVNEIEVDHRPTSRQRSGADAHS